MKTYKIEIVMDAVDEDDFINAIMCIPIRHLKEHVRLIASNHHLEVMEEEE